MFSRRILTYLTEWKTKPSRKPLIVRGARQVGKTSAILLFGERNFETIVHINAEKYEHARLLNTPLSVSDFQKIIRVLFHQELIPKETLLFIDEIQNAPHLLPLLRFLYEELPDLHVIAAGSLLEARIEKNGLPLPVGRVEYAYMYPLDFFEYLETKGERDLLALLRTAPICSGMIPRAIHEHALAEFHEYATVGGMPEAVKIFLERHDAQEIETLFSSLLTAYTEDIYKYTGAAQVKYVSFILEQAPLYAGSVIKYEKFGGGNFKSREMQAAFLLLHKVMILYQAQATKSTSMPLVSQPRRGKKLLFLDAGLVNYRSGVLRRLFETRDGITGLYHGHLAEQIVGQNILAQHVIAPPALLYWARDKKEGSAEVDFCMRKGDTIAGIEVKSGAMRGAPRSLMYFSESVPNHELICVSAGELNRSSLSFHGHEREVISLPFYLIPRIMEKF